MSSDPFNDNLEELFDFAEQTQDVNDSQSYPLLEELQNDQPRYSYESLIAKGGMKTITKVFDNKTSRFIAMAKLHQDAPKELYEPFLREAKLTAHLDHPNIISIHEVGLDQNEAPFFTMELKTGLGFNEIIKENSDTRKLLEIFLKVCDGISYSHSRKVLHLDIKAENIQAGLYGDVIICDWGLAKIIGHPNYDGGDFDRILLNPDLLNNMTLADEVRGTPGFMAPEQIDSKQNVSVQTDVYSLGALLYLILCKVPPIELSGTLEEVLQRTQNGEIIPPPKRFSQQGISAGLSAVCMKALATKPEGRYESVEALRTDVYNSLTNYSTSAENAGFWRELKLFYKRNSAICLIALFSLITIIALSSYFITGLQASIAEADRAKNIAEENQQKAIEEKNKTQEILKLYKEEQAKLSRLIEDHYKILKEEVYQITDIRMFENPQLWSQKAISTLDRMIDGKTQETWPYMQRAYVYFITQDLKRASKDLKLGNAVNRHFGKLVSKYQNQATEGEILDIKTFTSIISEMTNKVHRSQVLMMLRYDGSQRKSLQDHAKAVRVVLNFFNNAWDGKIFEFNEETSSLKLGGEGLTALSTDGQGFSTVKSPEASIFSLIKTLKIKKLDISGTAIRELQELAELDLETLNISHSFITKVDLIKKQFPNLKTLKISKGQINPKSSIWQDKLLLIIEE